VSGRALIVIPDEDYDRKLFIGSSNVAPIMGLGATYNGERYTAVDVYEAKIAEAAEQLPPDERLFLERRKRWEPVVVQMLREEFDAQVVAVNRRYRDPEVPYFASEIDFEWTVDAPAAASLGLDDSLIGSVQNGEIKTVSPFAFKEKFGWGDVGTGDVPIHYECQTQFGLGVTGREVCVVAAMVGLDNMLFYIVRRHDGAIVEMRETCSHFWTEHVLAKVPPEPQSIRDLTKLFAPPSDEAPYEADSDVGSKAYRYRAIASNIDALELERESLEFDLKRAMGKHDTLVVDGLKVITWKDQNFSRLDQSGLKEAHKDIYREFLRKGKHRVFKWLRSAPTIGD